MKAAFFQEHGDRDVLQVSELPLPEPGIGEVRVKVEAIALNHLDVFVRRGWPALKLQMPHIGGSDAAGVIDEIGPGVEGFEVGDEVVLSAGWFCTRCPACLEGKENLCESYHLFGEHRAGAAAEYFVAPQRNLLKKPKGLSWEKAASLGVAYITAWHMLVTRAKVGQGDTVLVQAGSSGVSVGGIQIAKIFGAEVIAVTSSAEKAHRLKQLGADEVIDRSLVDVRKEVLDITGKKGVDLVLEHVGGKVFEDSVKMLRPGGRLVLCGATTNPISSIDLRYVFIKHLSVLGATMGTRAELTKVLRWVEEGRILPVVDRVIPLEEIAEGHRVLEDQEHFGKVVLVPRSGERP